MNFSSDDSGENIFIPKDLYTMINGYENTYDTYGVTASFERKINNQISLLLKEETKGRTQNNG